MCTKKKNIVEWGSRQIALLRTLISFDHHWSGRNYHDHDHFSSAALDIRCFSEPLSSLAWLLVSNINPKWIWGKCAQFLAAVLKASLWLISGLLALILWISSFMNWLYAEGTRCLFSGGRLTPLSSVAWWSAMESLVAIFLLPLDDEPESFR